MASDGIFAEVEPGAATRVRAYVGHQEDFESWGALVHRPSLRNLVQGSQAGAWIPPSWPISTYMMMVCTDKLEALQQLAQPGGNTEAILEK